MNAARKGGVRLPGAVVAGGISTTILLALYLASAAPDLTFWDATELATAARTLGIPHPPGTPLWVLLGHVSALVFQAAGPARSITLLSVIASAGAGGLGAAMVTRWIGARGAVAAAVAAGGMMSVWSSATETEVYSVALVFSVALLYAGERAGRDGEMPETRRRWRGLLVFLAALAVPLHLSVLVALPAALAFAWRGEAPRRREIFGGIALVLLALSAVAVLPLLAARDPQLNSGNPVTLPSLLAVLQRKQYAVQGLWPRVAPLWLQIGNVFEWADWQVAYGLHPEPSPSWARTSLSVVWAWLAVLGVRVLWRRDPRVGRAMIVLLVSGTIGVALWLNLRAGPSFGHPFLPANATHEARERDYFFMLGFWAWGISAGAGLTGIAAGLRARLGAGGKFAQALAVLPLVLAAVPMLANQPVMDRRREPAATLPRTFARLLLESVPGNGVLYAAGDNDSFPLWYLQHVESIRTDVLVVTVPLLGAEWYRQELHRRHRLLPSSTVSPWRGLGETLKASAVEAQRARRAIRVSALLSADERRRIDPSVGWALEGLVYAPSTALAAGSVGLSLPALVMTADRVPLSALLPLPRDADGASVQMQALLRCSRIRSLEDSSLVATCNGS